MPMDMDEQNEVRPISDWGGVIAAFLVTITVNVLANALPIAGTTTGAVSEKYASSFTPAGFTFSIWGLIYLALAAYVTYQALPGQRGRADLAAISARQPGGRRVLPALGKRRFDPRRSEPSPGALLSRSGDPTDAICCIHQTIQGRNGD